MKINKKELDEINHLLDKITDCAPDMITCDAYDTFGALREIEKSVKAIKAILKQK